MQPNHLNLTHPLMNTQKASVTCSNNQLPNLDQRWNTLVLTMQKANPFRYTTWRKIRAVEIADFDCPGEPALKCKDDRLSRERPIPDYQNDPDCRSDRDKSSDDQAPAQQR